MRGAIFEAFVMSELFKYRYNVNERPNLFYWRDVQGHEVDALFEKSLTDVIPIEIKASMTLQPSFFKGIATFKEIAKKQMPAYIVYAGSTRVGRTMADVYSWNDIKALVSRF